MLKIKSSSFLIQNSDFETISFKIEFLFKPIAVCELIKFEILLKYKEIGR